MNKLVISLVILVNLRTNRYKLPRSVMIDLLLVITNSKRRALATES